MRTLKAALFAAATVSALIGFAGTAHATSSPAAGGATPRPIATWPAPQLRSMTFHATTSGTCHMTLQLAQVSEGVWTTFPGSIGYWDDDSQTTFGTRATSSPTGTAAFAVYEVWCLPWATPTCTGAQEFPGSAARDCGAVTITWRNEPNEAPTVSIAKPPVIKSVSEFDKGSVQYDDRIIFNV